MSRTGHRAHRRILAWLHRTGPHNCAICGRPINPALPSTDPLGLSYDEIIPHSSPNWPGHRRDNAQPAHLDCNRRRQAKPATATAVDHPTSRPWLT